MSPEQVPAEWVGAAELALADRCNNEHENGRDWCGCPDEGDLRAALAAVLPLHETGLLEALRLIDGEIDEADDFDGLNADAVQRIGWYIDPVRARLRAAETESEGSPS